MTGDVDYDVLVGRLRGLVIALTSVLCRGEAAEVEEFIDHAEFGEALRTLAWILVEEDKPISTSDLREIEALAGSMGIVIELPQHLSKQVRK